MFTTQASQNQPGVAMAPNQYSISKSQGKHGQKMVLMTTMQGSQSGVSGPSIRHSSLQSSAATSGGMNQSMLSNSTANNQLALNSQMSQNSNN